MHKFDYEFKNGGNHYFSDRAKCLCLAALWLQKDSFGKMDKSKHSVCKFCNVLVAYGGGMTNLQNQLHLNHSSEYLLLYPPKKNSNSPKVNVTQSRMEDFVSVPKLSGALMQVKINFNRSGY